MKTIVGLFDTLNDARSAANDLESTGFNRNDISIVAPRQAAPLLGAPDDAVDTGATIGAGLGILAGLVAMTIPGVGIVAAIGPLIAGGILGAVGGGLIGSLVEAGIPAEHAGYYAEGIRRGGTLVCLPVGDADEPRAAEIMRRHHPIDVQERSALWRRAGWKPAGPATARASNANPDVTGQTTMGDAADAMPPPHSFSDRA